jgi:transcriptional regulator with XRE-family HTH domain
MPESAVTNKLGQLLRYYRLAEGITLSQLSREIGVSTTTITNIEHGLPPDTTTTIKIIKWMVPIKITHVIKGAPAAGQV